MVFLWSTLLWLLLAVPLLVALYAWLLHRRKQQALNYPSLGLVRAALGPGQRLRRHIPPTLFLLALVALLLAAARPLAVITLPSEQQTIVLAMDVSGSMRATDVEPDRLTAAQNAAKAFIAELPRHVRVGIVAFAGSAQLAQLPTQSHEDLVKAIDSFQLQRGTATGNGIMLALATLFPNAGIDIAALGERQAMRPRSLDEVTRQDPAKTFTPVAPGSYNSAAIIMLTDGQRTTGSIHSKPPSGPPTGACACTPWAWARCRETIGLRAGRCACASTRKPSRRWPCAPRPNTSTRHGGRPEEGL
jgi:von Willebrand factor type A domain.